MTSQQFADRLLQEWQALWALKGPERARQINQIADEMQFEQELSLVSIEMEKVA
jgi:hypothetical protein